MLYTMHSRLFINCGYGKQRQRTLCLLGKHCCSFVRIHNPTVTQTLYNHDHSI